MATANPRLKHNQATYSHKTTTYLPIIFIIPPLLHSALPRPQRLR